MDQSSSGGRERVQAGLADDLGRRLGPAATFSTTEHFNLQTARAVTVSESNGRASIYLAALSSNLIALAFIGQMSRLGAAFYALALILLPVLAFMGVVTFLRLVQSSIEDIAYAHRRGRLRSFYLQVSPELEPYLVVVPETRSAAPFEGQRLAASAWQLTLTAIGMVAVLKSVVVAARVGLVLQAARRPLACGSDLPAEHSSARLPSRCTSATTVARATLTARRLSTGPRSSCPKAARRLRSGRDQVELEAGQCLGEIPAGPEAEPGEHLMTRPRAAQLNPGSDPRGLHRCDGRTIRSTSAA